MSTPPGLFPAIVAAMLSACGSGVAPPLVDVPFTLHRNQILLEVNIADQPHFVLLDSGGNPSVFDLATALEAGLGVDTTRFGLATGAGNEEVRIYPLEAVRVGLAGKNLGTVEAIAMDLTEISERLGHPLAGILGYSFLKGRVVQVDYPDLRFRLLPDDWTRDGIDATSGREVLRIPLVLAGTDPLVENFFVNGERVPSTLDTGSSLVFELYGGLERAGRLGITPADTSSVLGAQGESERFTATADSLRLGPFMAVDQEIAIDPEGHDRVERGNLGNGFLKQFVLTLDYANKALRIER